MLAVSFLAARWTMLRLNVPSVLCVRIGMGCSALVLMLVAEFGLVLRIRGLSIREYFRHARRGIRARGCYAVLFVFAMMPLRVAKK